MLITPHAPEDRHRLSELVAGEHNAKQRDRYRAVLLAMEAMEGDAIALRLARSPRFVDEWAARYRRGGVEALFPKRQLGRPPKFTPEQTQQLKARLDAGPRDTDGVCTRFARRTSAASSSRSSTSCTRWAASTTCSAPHRLLLAGAAAASPQERPGGDGDVQGACPLFVRTVTEANPGKRIRWFTQDEARIGEQGTLTRVWACTGSRPTAVRQTEYEWVYLWAAVEPASGASVGRDDHADGQHGPDEHVPRGPGQHAGRRRRARGAGARQRRVARGQGACACPTTSRSCRCPRTRRN